MFLMRGLQPLEWLLTFLQPAGWACGLGGSGLPGGSWGAILCGPRRPQSCGLGGGRGRVGRRGFQIGSGGQFSAAGELLGGARAARGQWGQLKCCGGRAVP